MKAAGGLIIARTWRIPALRTRDLSGNTGYDVLTMPPVSSGGVALLTMLNVLEGYDLARDGFGSAANVHRITEAMRRAYADRARFLGDPAFNPDLPFARLISKEHAAALRKTIDERRASVSDPARFEWPAEGNHTTHLTVVDADRNAVSLTYTLEDGYGSKIVVPGAGFLLNNQMGDFNAGPGLTDRTGLVGTEPNLARRQADASSMTPPSGPRRQALLTIGSEGGRTTSHTGSSTSWTSWTRMKRAVRRSTLRIPHQWLSRRAAPRELGLSPDTLALLARRATRGRGRPGRLRPGDPLRRQGGPPRGRVGSAGPRRGRDRPMSERIDHPQRAGSQRIPSFTMRWISSG